MALLNQPKVLSKCVCVCAHTWGGGGGDVRGGECVVDFRD